MNINDIKVSDGIYKDGLLYIPYADVKRSIEEHNNKYKWHDLKSNPTDLPEFYDTVDIRTVSEDYYYAELFNPLDKRTRKLDGWFTDDCCFIGREDVIAWRYPEPFGKENNED